MKAFLQKKTFPALLLVLSCARLPAAPPPGHFPGARQPAIVSDIWIENFSLPDGATADSGTTAWASAASYGKAIFGVYNNEFQVSNISAGGEGTWTSAPISIAGKTNVALSIDVRSAGGLENDATDHSDYLRCYYKVDGGAEVLFTDLNGKINNNRVVDSTIYATGAISGATLQIIIRSRASATNEFYYFDNIRVSGTAGCTAEDIPSGVSAASSDRLTCTKTSVTLTGASSTPGVTYNWSGPNGYSAGTINATVTTGGLYTLTVTNPTNGCFKQVPLTVFQNTTPPANVTAVNSGPLTCDVLEVTLTGNTASTNVAYQWDGPNNYQSFFAQDVTVDPGEYILTITNIDNGCKAKDTTTIVNTCDAARKAR